MMRRAVVCCLAICLDMATIGCSSAKSPEGSSKAAVLTVLAAGPDSLVGDYGVRSKNGSIQPLLRVAKTDTGYSFAGCKAGNWGKAEAAVGHEISRQDAAKLVQMGVDVPFTGIAAGSAAVLKVPAGWQYKTFSTSSRYFMLTIFGPVELVRL